MKMIYKSLGLTCIALAMSAVSAFAQPEDGKVYRINNIHDGYTFGENQSGGLVNQAKAESETTTQLWLAVAEKDVSGTATGRFAFVNASSGKCLNSGTAWTTAKNAEYFYVKEQGTQAADATLSPGQKYYNITTSSTAAGNSCLHCWSSASPQSYLGSGGGSRWTFTEATETTLSTIDASLASLFTECEGYRSAYDTFLSTNPITSSAITLQATDANAGNYIMSNAPHNGNSDNAGCAALLDGNTGTYFHSRYSGTAVNEPHYLQVKLSTAVSLFRFHYTRRTQNNNNRPTRIVVSGSNDGVNFTQLSVLTSTDATNPLPTAEAVNSYQSNVISTLGTPYTYLRFTVTATSNNALFGQYPFFTMSEFGIESVTASKESCVTACLNYQQNTQPYINGIQGSAAMSAVYLPLYYSIDLASIAKLGYPGEGVLEDKLTLIDYYVYYVDADGIKHYLSINDDHQGVLTTEPVAFRFVNGATTNGFATKAYQMSMNDYHLGHWNTNGYVGTDPNSNADTGTSPWHAQVIFYDAAIGRFAIRGTNAKGSGYEADKFYIVTADDQLAASNTPGGGLYQWHIQPAYPFSVSGQKYFIKTRVQQSGYTKHLFNYQTEGNSQDKINLVVDKEVAPSAYWTLNEVEEQGRYYLNIVPMADQTKVISYESAQTDGNSKLVGKAVGTSGWDARFVLEYTGNTQAPYLLRPSGQKTYVSNHGGQNNNMGFFNSSTDEGSRLNFIPVIEQGHFYRIKGNASSKYLDAAITGNRLGMSSAEEKDAAGSVFWFDNGQIISYSRGTYMSQTWNINGLGTANGDAIKVYPSESDVAGCYSVYHSYPTDQVKWLYDSGNDATPQVNRNGSFDATNCNWIFEPVTALPVNISSVGWSTFYAPVAVTIPEGVTAYAAGISGTTCTLTEVTGEVPAGTGLILYKQGGGTVEMPIIAGTEATVESSLTGSVETANQESGTTYYALQRNSQDANKVGLYLYPTGQLKGFHAFYQTTTESNVAGFTFDPDSFVTGIEAIQNNDGQAGHIYDLSGRRLSKPAKGWNIIGGQKVFVK